MSFYYWGMLQGALIGASITFFIAARVVKQIRLDLKRELARLGIDLVEPK